MDVTARGDIHVSSITGPVQAHFINGRHDTFAAHDVQGDLTLEGDVNDVTLSEIKGNITQSGDIPGDVHFETISGSVHLHTSVTTLDLAALPGDMTLDNDDLRVNEAKGPVHVRSALQTRRLQPDRRRQLRRESQWHPSQSCYVLLTGSSLCTTYRCPSARSPISCAALVPTSRPRYPAGAWSPTDMSATATCTSISTGPGGGAGALRRARRRVQGRSARSGGLVRGHFSAEHGIGRLKVGELERYAPPVELELMRAVERAFDPNGIMNPGKVLRWPPSNVRLILGLCALLVSLCLQPAPLLRRLPPPPHCPRPPRPQPARDPASHLGRLRPPRVSPVGTRIRRLCWCMAGRE